MGYGDICPSSDGSKLFTIAFSFIGVVQIGVAFEVGARDDSRRAVQVVPVEDERLRIKCIH